MKRYTVDIYAPIIYLAGLWLVMLFFCLCFHSHVIHPSHIDISPDLEQPDPITKIIFNVYLYKILIIPLFIIFTTINIGLTVFSKAKPFGLLLTPLYSFCLIPLFLINIISFNYVVLIQFIMLLVLFIINMAYLITGMYHYERNKPKYNMGTPEYLFDNEGYGVAIFRDTVTNDIITKIDTAMGLNICGIPRYNRLTDGQRASIKAAAEHLKICTKCDTVGAPQ